MMRLKAIRNFYMFDPKRGINVERKIGDEFEADETEQGEEIYFLLGGRLTIIDSHIPEEGEYLCLHAFSYKNKDGSPRTGTPGKEINLDQKTACEMLVTGFIKPVDPNQWIPSKLITGMIADKPTKKMFDEEEPPSKNWIMKHARRD